MQGVFRRVRVLAQNCRTVLVLGQTGTGKESIARAIHALSPRANRPWVVCNCAALPASLVESELFGHTKGAFTGAVLAAVGLFEHADGGTVFLDEIGELPLAAQAKLLRVLQNGEVQKIGSPSPSRVDVRIVAATNRNLTEMVRVRTFREDLYYRLSAFEIRLPPLSARHGDLPLLEEYFMERFRQRYGKPALSLTRRASAFLEQYGWPGNVRELENALEHGCVVTQNDLIDIDDLPHAVTHSLMAEVECPQFSADGAAPLPEFFQTLEEVGRDYAFQVLQAVRGNRMEAAKILGIGRTTLYRMMNGQAKHDGDAVQPYPPHTHMEVAKIPVRIETQFTSRTWLGSS